MTIDCVVVGGGIIGMMTARALSIAGLKVQILEKGKVGQESSWAGGGILSPIYPWDAPEEIWPMVSASQQVYPGLCEELIEETGIDPQWIQSGLLHLDKIDNDKLNRWSEKTGSNYVRLDRKQILEIDPLVDPKFGSAIWLADVAQVRTPRLLKALKASLLFRGVQIREGVEVGSISEVNGKVDGVVTSEGRINCEFVVIAAGAWSGRFLKDKSAINPVRGQMLRIEVPDGFLRSVVLENGTYLIPRKGGSKQKASDEKAQVLVGSTLEHVGFDQTITKKAAENLYSRAIKIVPKLKNYPISQQWSGLRPGSEKGIPIIESVENIEGLFVNSGHFRNGVVLAPNAALDLTDKIINSK